MHRHWSPHWEHPKRSWTILLSTDQLITAAGNHSCASTDLDYSASTVTALPTGNHSGCTSYMYSAGVLALLWLYVNFIIQNIGSVKMLFSYNGNIGKLSID